MDQPTKMPLPKKKGSLGQSTVEYILVLAFGAIFSIQVVKFFNDVFKDGLKELETEVQAEVETGSGFGG